MPASIIDRLLDLVEAIQQIPAPTFSERQRADFIYARFLAEELVDVTRDETGNVYARLPGRGEAPPLVITAHLDSVFPLSTDLQLTRQADTIVGPGIGDNALGLAGFFGLLWSLRQRDLALPGDLWLVANVGEEGLGDLAGMRAVVNRFGRQVLAYIVVEGLALGQVYHRGLGILRYRLTVSTPGGHSWVDFGRPSAIHVLAGLVSQLVAIPLPGTPRTTLNVGLISGGTSINTIASSAHLDLDLRSEDVPVLQTLAAQVEALVQQANRGDVEVTAEIIGQRPAVEISAQHPLVRLAVQCLAEQGIQPNLTIGSTDANLPLSLGLPVICLGLTKGGGAHTLQEHIQLPPIAQGLAQIVCLVGRAFDELSIHNHRDTENTEFLSDRE